MKTYIFNVEQVIEIKADSLEEARDLLPVYPYSPGDRNHYVKEETVELIKEGK